MHAMMLVERQWGRFHPFGADVEQHLQFGTEGTVAISIPVIYL